LIHKKEYTYLLTMSEEKKHIKIFRYKFKESTIEKMIDFARIHCYDCKEDLKEAWEEWKEEYVDMIKREQRRHEELGYEGKIEEKMYKSIRYYYMKKFNNKKKEDIIESNGRKKYVPLTKKIRLMMDFFIQQCIDNDSYKPSKDYERFYNDPIIQRHIHTEIDVIQQKYNLEDEDIREKIKKTYKNRYYMIRTKYIQD